MFRRFDLLLFTFTNNLIIKRDFKKRVFSKLNKMFSIQLENEKKTVEIKFSYLITPENEREFTFNRSLDEPLSRTFKKIADGVDKHLQYSQKKKTKKLKTEANATTTPVEAAAASDDIINTTVQLFDSNDKIISEEKTNEEAWKENHKIKINDRVYSISVSLPIIKKLALPKLLIANMPIVAVTEKDEKCLDNSFFSWYVSLKNVNNNQWELITEGVNKRMIVLDEKFEDKLIKLKCLPNDGKREGLPIEVVSQNVVKKIFDLSELPMTERHKTTSEKFSGNNLRVLTYNLLANCYATTSAGVSTLFAYCPLDYLEFKYRRSLLLHELIHYNADILFLQECDDDFFDLDLEATFVPLGYSCFFKPKGSAREGEAILFRNDRFKFIQSFDIRISDEIIKNKFYEEIWNKLVNSDNEMKDLIENRNTILQVALVESIEQPDNYILLANTHLFFHPKADFIRLLQAIISIKHLENIIYNITSKEQKKVTLLFAGDLNSDPASFAFQYLFTQQLPLNDLSPEQRNLVENHKDVLLHSLNLSTFADFKYTNYVASFNEILDYIFYDQNKFNLKRVVPMPTHEQVTKYVALPSKIIPSDHLAVVLELEWKSDK